MRNQAIYIFSTILLLCNLSFAEGVELCAPLGTKVFGYNTAANLEYKDEILGWKDPHFDRRRGLIEEGLIHEGWAELGTEKVFSQCSALQIIPKSTAFVEMNGFGRSPKGFMRALIVEKSKIRQFYKESASKEQTIDIQDDTYNRLAKLALGIMGAESGLGHSSAFAIENILAKSGPLENFAVCLKNELRLLKAGEPLPKHCDYWSDPMTSRGYTQIKTIPEIGNHPDYNITRKNLDDPYVSAIATMGFLIETYKWYLNILKQYDCSYLIKEASGDIRYEMKPQDFEVFLTYLYRGAKGQLINGTATPEKNCYYKRVQKYLEYVTFYVHPEHQCSEVDPIEMEETKIGWNGKILN